MKLYLTFFLFLLIFLSIKAQSSITQGFRGKIVFVDFSGLNDQIKGIYPLVNDPITEFSFGYDINWGRRRVGLYGNISLIANDPDRNKRVVFSGYGIELKYAYDIIKKKNWALFPELMIGARKYDLTLTDSANGVSIFDVINSNVNNYSFSNIGGFASLGMGINRKIPIPIKNLLLDVITIGVSGGYRLDGGEWSYQGVNPVMGELSRLSGAYIDFTLMFSLGNTMNKKG